MKAAGAYVADCFYAKPFMLVAGVSFLHSLQGPLNQDVDRLMRGK